MAHIQCSNGDPITERDKEENIVDQHLIEYCTKLQETCKHSANNVCSIRISIIQFNSISVEYLGIAVDVALHCTNG